MNFYENWVELDLNPIITFSSSGKLLYFNSEAQFLLNRISSKELYDLAVTYAPSSYGFETSYINLSLKNYSFYAISVGYESDEEIFVKFYKATSVKKEPKLSFNSGTLTNIFTLVDLNISTLKTKYNINFIKNYDPSIPQFKLDVPNLIKIIGKAFEAFIESKTVTTTIKLKVGEYIKIDGKKHSVVSIEILSDGYLKNCENLESNFSSCILTIENQKISIDLPMILS